MSVDHVSLPTGPANFNEVREFYLAILKPLGYKPYYDQAPKFLGLAGPSMAPDFWLHCGGAEIPKYTAATAEERKTKTHVAFRASSHKQVDEWYRNALKAGGMPNGEPGERAYVKGYYAAYVLDPLGNNIEAVYFNPLWLQALKALPTVGTFVLGAVVSQATLVIARKYGML